MTRIATHVGRIAVCTIAAAMLMIAARDAAAAQRGQTPPAPRPGWLPYYNSEIGGNLTAAQKAAATRVLEEFQRILLQVPELASPQGFEIMPQFWGGSRMLGPGGAENPNNVVEYALNLYFFAPTQAIAGEGCVCISVVVNSQVSRQGYSDEQGRDIFPEQQRGDPMPLATQVYGRLLPTREQSGVFVYLTSGGEPFWKTVTREEYYNAVIFSTEGKDGAKLADARKSLEKTPYQEWLEGAEQRKKDREETLRAMAALQSPAEVANMRKTLEDTEREVTESLRASEDEDRERNKEASAVAVTWGDSVRAELQSMTPAKRNMPALIDPTRSDGLNATGPTMADRDSLTMWRVIAPNYDFWRARKSPVEVRSIAVHIGASGTGLVPAVHNALWQTYKKLDWGALNRLLDVPR